MRLTRGTRRGVVAATLIMLGVLTGWAIVTPAFRAADEPAHVSVVTRISQVQTWESGEDAHMDPAIPVAYPRVGFVEPPWLVNPRLDRPTASQGPGAPSLSTLRQDAPPSTVPDAAHTHPPAYYASLAVPYQVLGMDDASPAGVVLALRLLSLLLLTPIPYFCATVALELGMSDRAVVAAAFVPVGWIQLLHASAGVNNGTLATTLVAAGTALLVPVVTRGEVSRKRALTVGLVVSAGLLTKLFTLGLLPMLFIAYAAAARHDRRAWRALFFAAVAAAPGVAWSAMGREEVEPLDNDHATASSVPDYLQQAVSDLAGSLWANLGWLNTPLPLVLDVLLTTAAVIALLVGSWHYRRRPALLAVLHLAWLVPLAMIVLWSIQYYRNNGFVDGMQGRYLLPAVVSFSVLWMTALARVAPWVVLASVVSAVGGLVFGLRAFWVDADPRIALAWWPHGELVVAASVLLMLAGLGMLLAGRQPRVSHG